MTKPRILAALALLALAPLTATAAPQFYNTIDGTPLNFDDAMEEGRDTEAVIKHHDDRLIVIVGPCSVHDVRAGLEYARRLRAYAQTAKADLHIIMRVYFEKPRYAAAATTC